MSTTIATRQFIFPAVFFVTGLGLLLVSTLPSMQKRGAPGYNPTTTPLSAPPTVAPTTKAKTTTKTTITTTHATARPVTPSGRPAVTPTAKPGATTRATPGPRASASNAFARTPGGMIPPTGSVQIVRDNPVTIGREDPFKSLMAVAKKSTLPPPPGVPGIDGLIPPAPGVIAKPSVAPKPTLPPATPPPLKYGLSLQGLVTGDEEPAAILNVDGNTQLVRVGDVIRRPGYVVTITNINERALSITLSDGKGHNDVLKTE